MRGRFYVRVLIDSVFPKAGGVAWHPTSWQLDLLIRLNRSLIN